MLTSTGAMTLELKHCCIRDDNPYPWLLCGPCRCCSPSSQSFSFKGGECKVCIAMGCIVLCISTASVHDKSYSQMSATTSQMQVWGEAKGGQHDNCVITLMSCHNSSAPASCCGSVQRTSLGDTILSGPALYELHMTSLQAFKS